ncbi:MAG: hypothetical protein LQ345_002352 [Seirophora villosa]|nr:MAG: hypothetical protein LQ345_002352 [Seirophora villosa]
MTPPGSVALLHQILEAQAAKTPQHRALECYPATNWSYADLNATANRLARYLRDKCSGSRKIVGLYLEKTDLLVIAVLGVLKAGMIWLPLPLDAPPARMEQILRSCEVALILTKGPQEMGLCGKTPCIRLDEVLMSLELQNYTNSNLSQAGQKGKDLCHILFTSGSTGLPKGVMIEHAAVVHNVCMLVKSFNLTDRTRTLQFAAPTFDIFGLDLFMTFACGGCLVMPRRSTILDDITHIIQEARITYTQLTPTVIQLISPADVPGLKILASSGETLPASLADKWRSRVRLINAYGPTETIVCSIQDLSGNEIDSACIGQGLDGLDVCLLADGSSDVVPEGEVGEICVAGPQLFYGYCSLEPDLEAHECFRHGQRYYRTGDRGRMEHYPTGEKTIRYLGRTDTQVKVHGIRVELSDVEQSILSCDRVHHCAVVLPRKGSFAGRLCVVIVPRLSFLVPESPLHPSSDSETEPRAKPIQILPPSVEVLGFLQEAKNTASEMLQSQVMPANWWPVKELPLTSSGKIDRMELRVWLEQMDTRPYAHQLGSTIGESGLGKDSITDEYARLLQSLWAEVLDRPAAAINPTASFVELGADSLDVIQFVSKARKAGRNVTFSSVYAAKTICQLARDQGDLHDDVGSRESNYVPFSLLPPLRPLPPLLEDVAKACGIRVGEVEDVYPCTPYQAGLMLLDLKHPNSYVCIFSWTFPPDLNVDRFRSAWDTLVAGEPVLRSRLFWDTVAQDFLQVVVRHKGITDLSKEHFERPMTLGHELCRGCTQWDGETQRWKFQLKIHHSIIDGWSLRLMLNRLKSLYFGEDADHPPRLPFTHFIRYRLEQEAREEAACQRFWRQYLSDFSPPNFPPSPSDRDHQIHATGRCSTHVPVDLRAMAAIHGVTRATIVYGAAALVLSVHSDSEDIAPGLILAGRDAPLDGISDMLGPAFVTFPFRAQIDRDSTLSSYLKEIEHRVLEIVPHQHYGLQRIRQCGPGPAAACEIGCLIVVQPEDEILAGEPLWEKAHGQTSGLADNIPLSFELILADRQILIKCNYDPALMSDQDVSLLLSHLNCVLQSLPAMSPQDRVSQARFADEDEHSRMLKWAHGYGAPLDRCLHDLFLDAAQAHPERTAIEDQGTARLYSYSELDTVTAQLSAFLRSNCSIAPGGIIPVAVEKSALAIITILAVLRAGAAYVPVDQHWPLERVRHILHQTNATVIICSPTTAQQYSDLTQKATIVTEGCWNSTVAAKMGTLIDPSSLALIMYTSGSTGVPKGVMLEHGALSTSLHHLSRVFALRPGARHMQFSSLVYDVSVADIFIALISGACICVPTEDSRRNRLSATMKDMAIESAILTPSVVDLLSPDDCDTLRTLMTGGEMSRKSLIGMWARKVRLLNAYGPTEASITTTVSDRQTADADPRSIGKNITGWHWIVRRGKEGQIYPAPMGCVGEMAIAGHSLARGYLGNDGLTKASFVEAPQLAGGPISGRVYLTGDLGRYNADETISIVGRKDRMVKVNGIRVDPGEPEYHLRHLGGIFSSSVVDWIYDAQHNVKITAFVEVGDDGDAVGGNGNESNPNPGHSRLRVSAATPAFFVTCQAAYRTLQQLLPPRNIPSLFVPITRIPYTSSDKINIKLLKDELQLLSNPSRLFGINRGVENDGANGRKPATPSEIALEAAFRVVFGEEHQLTTAADFFHLGGDSLHAIKLVAAARDRGFDLSVQQVYAGPVLEHLAAIARPAHQEVLASSTRRRSSVTVPDRLRAEVAQQCHIPSETVEDLYPASPFQEGLAATAFEDHGCAPQHARSAYSATITYALASDVHVPRLHRALASVVSRNPIYRTTLAHLVEGTMQIVHRSLPTSSEENQEGSSHFRWRIDQEQHCLVLSIHHALYDAWTIEYLLEDVNHNYNHPDHCRPGHTPYRRFIEYIAALDQDDARSYWGNLLRNAPISPFPLLKPHHQAQAIHSAEHQIHLDLASIRTAKVSIATVIAAATALLISAYCYTDDVCYGMTLSGRDDPDLQDVAGPTLSTVPVRLRIRRDREMAEYLDETQALLLAMRRYQHYGLQNIARLPVDGIRNASQFRTLLVVQHGETRPTGISSRKVIQDLIPDMTSMNVNYPLVLIARADSGTGCVVMRIEYDPECLERVQAIRFIEQLGHLTRQCTPTARPVSEVDLLTTPDHASIWAWNSVRSPAAPQYLHQLFEDMVARQPERLAIDSCFPETYPYRRLSYLQLHNYATDLSKHIKGLAAHQVRIGLCFRKSPLMIIAMLAVWKAGRTFATFDPSAPVQRLHAILQDVGGDAIILTQPDLANLFAPSRTLVLDPSLPTLLPEDCVEAAKGLKSELDLVSKRSDIAYVMYTSGSSGVPKGVVVSQSAIATSLQAVASIMRLHPETRMLQFAAFTFDTSLLEIFATLTTGGCICMPSDSQRLHGGLADVIRRLHVTQLILTPTVAQYVQPEEVPTVQGLMLVGEPPTCQVIEQWATAKPTAQILNGYGPTEASVHAATNTDLRHDDASNIGYPTACNLFLTVPDQVDKLAAVGTIGELIICGNSLAQGYLDKLELTARAFGANLPWMPEPTRYYRTGDLARYKPDGSLVYLGRKDLQAKIHGQRIELQEIEWHIRNHGTFLECVVELISPDLLVAFMVVESSQQRPTGGLLPPDTLPKDLYNGLRTYLRSELPIHMIPAVYVPVGNMPKTTSGKIDRRQLRESIEPVVNSYRLIGSDAKLPLATTTQRYLAELWADALSIPADQIGAEDTISILGGDSIAVIRILAGARKRGWGFHIKGTYHHSTLEKMADSLTTTKSRKLDDHLPPPPFCLISAPGKETMVTIAARECRIPSELVMDVYPCAPMQQSLMIASIKSPGAYFDQEIFRIAQGTSVPRLISSLQSVWARHQILRTRIFLDEQFRSFQAVMDESLEVPLLQEQDLKLYLRRDAEKVPIYGDRLSRCALIQSGTHTYLVFSRHHAVFDGWSRSLLLEDIHRQYRGLPEARLPPGAYSTFVRSSLEVQRSPVAEAYWKELLTDLTVTPLPQLKESSVFEANQRYTLEVPSLPRHAHSFSTIAEAAWSILLARYTQVEDVSYGVVRSGRASATDSIDSIMGPTMATVPRRLRPLRNQRLDEYLQQVHARITEAVPWESYGHQNIRCLGHGAEQACKFRSLLVVQMPTPEIGKDEANLLSPEPLLKAHITRGDYLIVECQPQERGQLSISLTFDDRALSLDDVRWMTYHFSCLLSEVSGKPDKLIQDLAMAGAEDIEFAQKLNSTAIVPCSTRVDELFVRRSQHWPNLTAIEASDATLTYQELEFCTSRLAVKLQNLGVSSGDIVPLYMTKSSAMVVAMLAVLKAGAAYAPLAVDSPHERTRLLLERICARHILCTSDQESSLGGLPIKLVPCEVQSLMREHPNARDIKLMPDRSSEGLGLPEHGPAATNDVKPTAGSRLAYVLFTSGSTGVPKGVLIEHTALATTILENGRQLNFTVRTRMLSFAAYTFDVSVMEIYLTLLHGGCLFIPNEEQRLGNLSGYMNKNKIEIALLTPTVVRNMLQSPSLVPSLKTLRVGGEPLSYSILQQWSSGLRLINSYGPTETCVDACRNAHITSSTDPGNIGYPIGTHLWVVEPGNRNRLAPIGCPGELLVSGPTLARGYLNDEVKTAEAFIEGNSLVWASPADCRFYATGDVVRQNSDGSIHFLGRVDLQMKVNGFRIEVEEVEHAIESGNGITAAVVDKVRLEGNESEVLIAFLTVPDINSQRAQGPLLPPTASIKAVINEACTRADTTLLPFMRPQFYLPLERIPLTPSGKVDRGALRRIFDECSRDQLASYRSGPVHKRSTVTNIERVLQGLWAQVLSLNPSQIGLESDFIGLGGESLAAIRLAGLCRDIKYGLDIADILKNPRLEQMASRVEMIRGSRKDLPSTSINFTVERDVKSSTFLYDSPAILRVAKACGLDPVDIEDIYPCTPTQESLMAVTARNPEAYIARELFHLSPSLDMEQFRSAWEKVYQHNPVLRTRICPLVTEGRFEMVQVVCTCPADWAEVAAEDVPPMKVELGKSLIRFRLLRTHRGLLFEISKHHSIYDGFSTRLIWDDFRHAFSGSAKLQPRPLYRTYAHYVQSQDEEKCVQFWREYLEGFQGECFPRLPSNAYTPKATSRTCCTTNTSLRWDDACRFTFATVAKAAWSVILAMRDRRTGSAKDVCFAGTSSGRTARIVDLERMVGPTITTVPIRTKLDTDQHVGQFLQQVQDQALSMLPFEQYGLSQIRGICSAAREACSSMNLLVVQPASLLEQDMLPPEMQRVELEGQGFVETFGLVVECVHDSDQDSMALSVSYDSSLISEKEASNLIQQLGCMIIKLNQSCNDKCTIRSAIWSIVENDIQRMLAWNSTSLPDPTACLHELAEDTAGRRPDTIAVDAYDGKLQYGELDAAGDALAATLQTTFGIQPGDLVPICFEKSSAMIVAILGVLKAGAGYVPLDIDHPASRMDYIIQDVRARLVVISPMQAASRSFPVPTLIASPEVLSRPWDHLKRRSAKPSDIAYVTFTSGSTGKPKGVITEHGASRLSVLEHGKRYQHHRHGNELRTLQYSSYAFDASVLDIFATMAYGGCLCIPSEQDRTGNLEEYLIRKQVNFADLTPTIANLLKPHRLPELRVMAIGGEMATRSVTAKWTGSQSPLEYFVNSYGPTEAAIGCAAGQISGDLPLGHVGKRVGGSLWIVDETDHDKLLPISCTGELVVSGPTLSRGYLNDSELTEKAFIETSPWLRRIGEKRFYKTGDIARIDVDGNVEVIGRKDDGQIKLHGLRLELGEIEVAIRTCHSLATALNVCAAKVDLNGKPAIAAFIQLRDVAGHPNSIFTRPSKTHPVLTDKEEQLLRDKFPAYMIPRLWLPVASWPLTASGKTDRRCLVAACEALSPDEITTYQRAGANVGHDDERSLGTQAERSMADAWRQVLRKDREAVLEPDDDFFKLGGDSLGVIMLVALLKEQHISVLAHEVFTSRSLRGMANLIEGRAPVEVGFCLSRRVFGSRKADDGKQSSIASSSSEHFQATPPTPDDDGSQADDRFRHQSPSPQHAGTEGTHGLSPSASIDRALAQDNSVEEILPASFMQLCFLIEGQKWCRAYYAWWFLSLAPSTSIAQTQQACCDVMFRHPILRTSFHLVRRQCYQVVRKSACELSILFHGGSWDSICNELDKDVQQPVCFDRVLTRFRLLINTESGQQTLALGLSHAQYDGFCLPTILNNLRSACMGETPHDRPRPSYRRFIAHSLQTSNEEADAFWHKTLQGSSPTSMVRQASKTRPVMDHSIKRAIPFHHKRAGDDSYVVMLKAAWALVLFWVSRSADVTFGHLVSGRFAAFEGVHEVVGPCLNVIPARIVIDPNSPVRDLLQQIQEQQVAAIPYESVPFDRIARQADWPASTTPYPAIFQYQSLPDQPLAEDDPDTGSSWTYSGNACYGGGLLQAGACWLMAWPERDGYASFRFTFAKETLPTAAAERILDMFFQTLCAINDSNKEDTVALVLPSLFSEAFVDFEQDGAVDRQDETPHSTAYRPAVPVSLTAVTERIRSFWTQILGGDGPASPPESEHQALVFAHDASFFDIGGDSISAAELAGACTRAGLNLSLQDILDYPTLEQQTLLVAGQNSRPAVRDHAPRLIFSPDHAFN